MLSQTRRGTRLNQRWFTRVCVWLRVTAGLAEASSCFGHTEFAMPMGYPGGDVQKAVGNVSLELQKEVMAGDVDLGATFIWDSGSHVAARDCQGTEL